MFTVNLNTLFAAIAALIGISGWVTLWRKAAMAEGKHLEEMRSMKEKQADLEKKVEFLRGCSEESNAELKGLKIDVDWIKTTLSEIKDLLRKP